jgi:hypothetical protein
MAHAARSGVIGIRWRSAPVARQVIRLVLRGAAVMLAAGERRRGRLVRGDAAPRLALVADHANRRADVCRERRLIVLVGVAASIVSAIGSSRPTISLRPRTSD